MFFQFRKQVIKLIECPGIKSQRVRCIRIDKSVIKMMKAHGVIAEPGRLGHEIIGKLLVEIVCCADQIRPEKTDPLSRRVTK